MHFELTQVTEQMRPVVGYEGFYSVTRDGRVWSHRYRSAKAAGTPTNAAGAWLQPWLTLGYPYVGLCRREGDKRGVAVHRLVAGAWLVNPDPARCTFVNHKDGNKENNSADNLEWCTQQQNNAHAYATGLCTANNRKLTLDQAATLRARHAAGELQMDLACEFGISAAAMSCLINLHTYKGGKSKPPASDDAQGDLGEGEEETSGEEQTPESVLAASLAGEDGSGAAVH